MGLISLYFKGEIVMRIQTDSLKYAKILNVMGFSNSNAQALMSILTKIEIYNLYSKAEVDKMLSESVKEVFFELRREFNTGMLEQRREFDERMQSLEKYHDQQLKYQGQQVRDNKNELLISRRWLVGTVITVGLSLAAYLSTLLHFSH